LIETIVVTALLAMVIGMLYVVFSGGQRMDRAAGLTVSMLGALLVQERITVDLKQLGIRPGPEGPVRIGQSSIAFYRAHFEGPSIHLRPVRYSVEPTPRGNFRLVREEYRYNRRTDRAVVRNVVLRSIRFEEAIDPLGYGRYLTVYLRTLNEDLPLKPADELSSGRVFPLAFLNECPLPALIGATCLSDSAGLVIEGELPPITPPSP